jgi:acyl-CoA oxidase
VETFLKDHQYMVRLFQYRVLVNTAKVADKMERAVADGTPVDVARNNNALMLNNTATSHIYFFMLRTFADECANQKYDPACRAVLSKMCSLMACADLMEGNQWHGLLREGEIDLIEEATSVLLTQLRPEMVSLVDAFDYPDNLLSSALGKYDGNYQEALLQQAIVGTDVFHAPNKPPHFFEAVDQFLDRDYLALANGPVPDAMKIALIPKPASAKL